MTDYDILFNAIKLIEKRAITCGSEEEAERLLEAVAIIEASFDIEEVRT